MNMDLSNFIKYCLGYIKLTRQRHFLAQKKFSVELAEKYLDLTTILSAEGETQQMINLEVFYKFDPKKVPEEDRQQYEEEKAIALKIEDIYSKHMNDQFTKQVSLSFGYFEIEVPIEIDGNEEEEEGQEDGQLEMFAAKKIDRYPLFSFGVKIEKDQAGRYFLAAVDEEVQTNLSVLETILGEDLYYQLVEEVGKHEIDGMLSIPITNLRFFESVWHKIKSLLKLKEAIFDEESFNLREMKLALVPRANYFLAEDLQKLAQMEEEELIETALSSWVSDEELSVTCGIPEEHQLYFPFPYDKYKLRVLSLLNNKTAVVQGPPGTGKSETIANLLCHLAAQGHKVLFVSQKSQALKVVKDKLKRLGVKYLFGYIPNPASSVLGEEDETDGIAPQLAGIGAHIEAFSHRTVHSSSSISSLAENVQRKTTAKQAFSTAIALQREIWQLKQELVSLEKFDIPVDNITLFGTYASNETWNRIRALKNELLGVERALSEKEADRKIEKFKKTFDVEQCSEEKYSEALQIIFDDVARTGYDRSSRAMRSLNNFLRNARLRGKRTLLPREIVTYVDEVLDSDISRRQATLRLKEFLQFLQHCENLGRRRNLQRSIVELLEQCGFTEEQYLQIAALLKENSSLTFEDAQKNIGRLSEIRHRLSEMQTQDPNRISKIIGDAEESRRRWIASYLQNIVNHRVMQRWSAGASVRRVITRIAKAFHKSKRAFKTFDKLRKDPSNFLEILDLIPVWMMELDDGSRLIPLQKGIFDYVILDEASQCNVAYTLPAMFRAKRALFVGDSEQMRDNTIMFKSNKAFDELARRYRIPSDLQIKATGSSVQSVLDMADARGCSSVQLQYHYRSPAELIGFSNKYFYQPKGKELIALNTNYLTFDDTDRVMLTHHVQSDWRSEIADNINVAEAEEILKLFKHLREDPRYRDKSVGILSFFNAQASFIRRRFEEEGFKEESDNYKVGIIEGIQGDEKDIIIYSFVIRSPDQKKMYLPLTGEGGDLRRDINRGRVNVAFSRARQQVHCFTSLPISSVPEGIWIKKYLEYVEEHGEIDFFTMDLKPFDSFFEEEFYHLLKSKLKKGYIIRNQVHSCGFRIDFVVTNSKSGLQVAIECDGPMHFKDEVDEELGLLVEDDEERQRVLMAAGWTFYRLQYSEWIREGFDRESAVQDIIRLLV